MGRRLTLLSALVLTFSAIMLLAQEASPPKSEPVLSKLFPVAYPPLARQARITGNVEIALRVRQDGTVESADFISGHPMLREAALESARKSQFECNQCTQELTSYTLAYRFVISDREPQKACAEPEAPAPATLLDTSKHEVTVSAWQTWTCDPSRQLTPGELIRVRSAKCLYLWKCGIRLPM